MSLWILNVLRRLIAAINSQQTPAQLAGGVVMGVIIGLVPANGFLTTLLLLILYFINVNIAIAAIAALLVSFLAFLIDGLAHIIGFWLLSLPILKWFWTLLYNMPIVPFTRFNNTVTLGSLVIGLLLAPLVYRVSVKGVLKYREKWLPILQKTHLFKVVQASRIAEIWNRLNAH